MMKPCTAIVLLGVLGVLGGCSTSTPEPAPGPAPIHVSFGGGARTLGRLPSDVVATTIHARPPLDVARQLVQVSTPLTGVDAVGVEGTPQETSHTDTLHIAPRGVAGVYNVPIDTTGGEAYLFLSPQVEGDAAIQAALRNVDVLDPNGVKVNARPSKGMGQPQALEMSAIPLAGHPAGVYTVQFHSGAPEVGLAIEARLAASNIVLKLKPSTLEHLLGNENYVDATLTEGGAPILGAHVTADMISGQDLHEVSPMTFTEVGDGVYRALVHPLLGASNDVGAYLTDVRAEGTSPGGVAFFRHGRTGFHYGIPTARIVGVADQRTVRGGDGMITAFEADVDIESSSLDRLEISAKLTALGSDGQEHPIGIAHSGAGFDAGTHRVTLRLDAGHVRLTGFEGDFYLRDLQMYSLGTNTVFHREAAAGNRVYPGIARSSLRPLVDLTPSQRQLVGEGIFHVD